MFGVVERTEVYEGVMVSSEGAESSVKLTLVYSKENSVVTGVLLHNEVEYGVVCLWVDENDIIAAFKDRESDNRGCFHLKLNEVTNGKFGGEISITTMPVKQTTDWQLQLSLVK